MKEKLKILFAVSLAASAVTVLAFLNNLVAIVRWWHGFLAAGGDSSVFPARASGFIPALDWTVVDYSAVTTLIPALGCVCLSRALRGLLKGRRFDAAAFPFFKGSDQLNIALGLFGTLWGIIVIGYFQLDSVTMADLMQCLHTALFSTLMAVVWVFMIDRPLLRPAFRELLLKADLAEVDEDDLAGAVERLVRRINAASDAFDARQKTADAIFRKRMEKYEEAFEARQKEYTEFFTRRIAELERRAAEERARAKEAEGKLAAVAQLLK